ncbi:hypothetical protein ACC730_37660, partial [Rhizobium ruizarguesonis]
AYDGSRLIGTPPRLYNHIVRQIAAQDAISNVELAKLLALINLAMADSGIVAWNAKYTHAIWRPVISPKQADVHFILCPRWNYRRTRG